ncbi:MAG: MBL fold metallo-hydrolase [Thermoplasmata archaeon]|nr:MBL fold metallo-hydrolase [Thermoplasmata archaeon]
MVGEIWCQTLYTEKKIGTCMEVELLASDSMGVRSMATAVRTPDLSMVIDPGVALGPLRFSLPPASVEEKELEVQARKIDDAADKADILVLSHYHYDHHTPVADMFKGKKVFLKDIRSNINKSQKGRAEHLLSLIDGEADIVFSDGQMVEEGDTTILFSPPFPHGPQGTRLGYVIMTAVSHGGERVVHTSDVEGLLTEEELEWVVSMDPTLVVADGPPTYLLGFKFSRKSLEDSISNLGKLLDRTKCRLVVDHHLLRDMRYKEKMGGLFEDRGSKVTTFAGYNGVEPRLLEARRKEFHKKRGEN